MSRKEIPTSTYCESEEFGEQFRDTQTIPESSQDVFIVGRDFPREGDPLANFKLNQDFCSYTVQEGSTSRNFFLNHTEKFEQTLSAINAVQEEVQLILYNEQPKDTRAGQGAPCCINGEAPNVEPSETFNCTRKVVWFCPVIYCCGGCCALSNVNKTIAKAKVDRPNYLKNIIQDNNWQELGYEWKLRGGSFKRPVYKGFLHFYREWWEIRRLDVSFDASRERKASVMPNLMEEVYDSGGLDSNGSGSSPGPSSPRAQLPGTGGKQLRKMLSVKNVDDYGRGSVASRVSVSRPRGPTVSTSSPVASNPSSPTRPRGPTVAASPPREIMDDEI